MTTREAWYADVRRVGRMTARECFAAGDQCYTRILRESLEAIADGVDDSAYLAEVALRRADEARHYWYERGRRD